MSIAPVSPAAAEALEPPAWEGYPLALSDLAREASLFTPAIESSEPLYSAPFTEIPRAAAVAGSV
ncbi:MAG TPA: hypothetical protein VJX67_01050 [Blastocatellia bacterium]|nr:hypothetical protein [Blastocatellia bacterium]